MRKKHKDDENEKDTKWKPRRDFVYQPYQPREPNPEERSRKESIYSKLASQFRLFKEASPEVKAAIIGGIFLILFAILNESGLITDAANLIRTRSIVILSDERNSGYITLGSNTFATFGKGQLLKVGDNETDAPSRVFLDFYLGDIPDNAVITKAELRIPCTVQGDISKFGDLSLNRTLYSDQSTDIFNRTNPYDPSPYAYTFLFPQNRTVLENCPSAGFVTFSGEGLAKRVEYSIRNLDTHIQFALYFNNPEVNPNGSSDGIVISKIPSLLLWFIE